MKRNYLKVTGFKNVTFFLFLTMWSSLGCRKQEAGFSLQQLDGRWELIRAQVDNEDTDRLHGLYFVFLPDTSVQTNILGSERNYKYRFNGQTISQLSDPAFDYTLQQLNDTSLTMQSQIRGSVFTIFLNKAAVKTNTEQQ